MKTYCVRKTYLLTYVYLFLSNKYFSHYNIKLCV
jgi:hypothetical protein